MEHKHIREACEIIQERVENVNEKEREIEKGS